MLQKIRKGLQPEKNNTPGAKPSPRNPSIYHTKEVLLATRSWANLPARSSGPATVAAGRRARYRLELFSWYSSSIEVDKAFWLLSHCDQGNYKQALLKPQGFSLGFYLLHACSAWVGACGLTTLQHFRFRYASSGICWSIAYHCVLGSRFLNLMTLKVHITMHRQPPTLAFSFPSSST